MPIPKRNISIAGIDESIVKMALESISEHFGDAWLNSSADHPVKQLWQRKDRLSLNELFILGMSISRICKINNGWLHSQIEKVKGGDDKNRSGALFEIMGLGYLSNNNLSPENEGNPGFDGTIEFSNGGSIRLSLKNYGLSSRHDGFMKRSYEFKKQLLQKLTQIKASPIMVFVDFYKSYPENSDWTRLTGQVDQMLDNFKRGVTKKVYEFENFIAIIDRLGIDNDEKFDEDHCSYSLIVAGAYHKNEHANLISQLEDACANITKHSKIDDPHIVNMIFVHIPTTASLTNCYNWIGDYFQEHPDKPIGGIILYQPAVVSDISANTWKIDHCVVSKFNDAVYVPWITYHPNANVDFDLFLGSCSSAPSTVQLIADSRSVISVDNRYIYQVGEHFIKAKIEKDGTAISTPGKVASGIIRRSVFQPLPNEKKFIISTFTEESDGFAIL